MFFTFPPSSGETRDATGNHGRQREILPLNNGRHGIAREIVAKLWQPGTAGANCRLTLSRYTQDIADGRAAAWPMNSRKTAESRKYHLGTVAVGPQFSRRTAEKVTRNHRLVIRSPEIPSHPGIGESCAASSHEFPEQGHGRMKSPEGGPSGGFRDQADMKDQAMPPSINRCASRA